MAKPGVFSISMIGLGKKKKEEKEESVSDLFSSSSEEADSPSLAAAEDLLSALSSKDAQAVDDALRAHYEACKMDEDYPESEDEEAGEE